MFRFQGESRTRGNAQLPCGDGAAGPAEALVLRADGWGPVLGTLPVRLSMSLVHTGALKDALGSVRVSETAAIFPAGQPADTRGSSVRDCHPRATDWVQSGVGGISKGIPMF